MNDITAVEGKGKGGTRPPGALGEGSAKCQVLIERNAHSERMEFLRLRRSIAIAFGEVDPPYSRANGSIIHGQSSAFSHNPAATGFSRM